MQSVEQLSWSNTLRLRVNGYCLGLGWLEGISMFMLATTNGIESNMPTGLCHTCGFHGMDHACLQILPQEKSSFHTLGQDLLRLHAHKNREQYGPQHTGEQECSVKGTVLACGIS